MTLSADTDQVVTPDMVAGAEEYLASQVLRTPCEHSPSLSRLFDRPVWIKWELMQPTRSFKVRGALVTCHHVRTSQGVTRVGTASTGNHGLGVAHAARVNGQDAVVFAPVGSNPAKLDAIRDLGAEVRIVGTDWQDAYAHATKACQEEERAYVHSFDDPYIVAGQATVGTEIAEQVPDAATVVVPIGGGGLIAGVATGLAQRGSSAEVVGVQPTGADAMGQSLRAGHPVMIGAFSSIADGLAARRPGDLTFAIAQALVSRVLTVSEESIRQAMARVLRSERILIEPSSATTVAALAEHGRSLPQGPAVVIASGGNVNPALLPDVVARAAGAEPDRRPDGVGTA